MTVSATSGTLERRMLRTAEQLTAVSRRLTAQRGLHGFTVEEVCDEVGISRRTFFNYFPSKEDAVIGADQEDESRRIAEEFVARGSRGWNAVIDDIVELVIEHFEATGIDRSSHAQFIAAVEREPRLLARLLGATRDRERQIVAVVAEREGVTVDDPRAEISVSVLAALLRTAGEHYVDPSNDQQFGTILNAALRTLRTVLDPSPVNPTPIRPSSTRNGLS
jgi:AcrR family transcriptional regulator